jgi:hypothetical protein
LIAQIEGAQRKKRSLFKDRKQENHEALICIKQHVQESLLKERTYNSYKPQKKCVIAKVYIMSSLAASPISDYQHPTWLNMREKHPTL